MRVFGWETHTFDGEEITCIPDLQSKRVERLKPDQFDEETGQFIGGRVELDFGRWFRTYDQAKRCLLKILRAEIVERKEAMRLLKATSRRECIRQDE